MPATNFLRHWKDGITAFRKNLDLLKSQVAEEPVHDLRVSTKKLRSYSKLLELSSRDKSFDETEQLFSVLGKQRNIDISKLLAAENLKDATLAQSFLLFLHLLHEQAEKYCELAIKNYPANEMDALDTAVTAKISSLTDEQVMAEAAIFIHSSLKEIRTHLKHFDEEYHLARKKLKDIFYWAAIFPSIISKRESKLIEKALEQLGQAQDHEVLLSFLKTFRRIFLNKGTSEFDTIKKAEQKTGKKQDQLVAKAAELVGRMFLR